MINEMDQFEFFKSIDLYDLIVWVWENHDETREYYICIVEEKVIDDLFNSYVKVRQLATNDRSVARTYNFHCEYFYNNDFKMVELVKIDSPLYEDLKHVSCTNCEDLIDITFPEYMI